MQPHVHDLVRVDAATIGRLDLPAWARASLARAPWLVVRRTRDPSGIPVGVRGSAREERRATVIGAGDVVALRRPEDRVAAARLSDGRLGETARLLDGAARAAALAWGPTGSYGFELASGVPATHAGSDLDCIVRGNGATQTTLLAFAASCSDIARALHARIDVEIAFDHLGVALIEYASGRPQIAAKTADGPALVERTALVCRA
ncbi:MAG: malonate decarboxylase holo-ACP synthase [Vulcanimicrobiaceae bacterium]